ncbi:MAG: autotransporter-associated beta strand repeat-containing protein, partial [Kiritimatiellia bacterium]|nr:autotransporter-associated beta strand repeat-containing protein [Kiritimatiellia bacterium]
MKKSTIIMGIAGLSLMALPNGAQSVELYWDVNGPAAGYGTAPRYGDWDTAVTATSTNWSTSNSAGTLPTVAWPGNTYPVPSYPDEARFRHPTAGSPGTLLAPDFHVNVVGTQVAMGLRVDNGAYVVLSNGTIRVEGVGMQGSTVILVGDSTSGNTLHVFSDVLVGIGSNTTFTGTRQVKFISGTGNPVSDNSLIFAGKIGGGITNRIDLMLELGSGLGGSAKTVFDKTSVIENGNSHLLGVEFGHRNRAANMIGRIEIYSTNTYTGASRINSGKTVVYVDAANNQAGAFGNASSNIDFGMGQITSIGAAHLLTGQSGVTIGRSITINSGTGGITDYAAYIGGEHTSGTSTYSGQISLAITQPRTTDVHVTAADGGTVRFTGNIVSGTAGGNTPLNKVGLGTVELAGSANTYSGPTKVTEGTLLVTGQTGT